MNDPSHLSNFPGLILAAILAGAIAWDVRRDIRRLICGRNVVLAGILAWFLLEAVMLSPGLSEFSQGTYNYSIFCVALAAGGFLAAYYATPGFRLWDPVVARFRMLDHPRVLWAVVVVCAIIGFAPVLFYSGLQFVELMRGILGMRKTWGGVLGRARYGGVRDALLQLEFFVKGAGPLAVLLLLDRRTTIFQKCFCFIVALWPLLRAYGSGTRSALVMSVLPVLAILYFKVSPKIQRRMVLAGLLSMPVVYLFMAAMVESRGSGSFSWEAAWEAKYVGNEMFQELAFITSKVPGEVGFLYGQSYYVQVVNPIPRFLWKGKPKFDTGLYMARLKGHVDPETGEPTMTNSPGLIGEMYFNFGLAGVIGLSALGGWFVRGWDRIAWLHRESTPTLILYCMGLAVLFIMGRSFNMPMLYRILFLLVGVHLATLVFDVPRVSQVQPATSPSVESRGGRRGRYLPRPGN